MKFIKCDNNTTKFQGSLSTYNMINVAENLFIPITIFLGEIIRYAEEE